jgi:predicted transcriptional regulator
MSPRNIERATLGRTFQFKHCEDMLQCVFNLNPLEVKVYRLLLSEGPLMAEEVAERVEKDPSTAYRCLRSLMACRICYKEQRNRQAGGYHFLYFAEGPDEVRKKLKECLVDWSEQMNTLIAEFPRGL